MQKTKVHIATTVLGLLLAVALVFANVLLPQQRSVSEKKIKTEQKTPDQQYSFVSAPTITPPSSSATIECSLVAHCIFEIEQRQQHGSVHSVITLLRPQKLFKTLFRVTIAPNAP
jgi:hypothetical protein